MEILVSLVLLVLISVGLVNLFISSGRFIAKSQGRMAAGEIGRTFMEPRQMDVNQATWGAAGNCLSGGGGCPAGAVAIGPFSFAPFSYVTSDVFNPFGTRIELRRVRVVLQWNVNP